VVFESTFWVTLSFFPTFFCPCTRLEPFLCPYFFSPSSITHFLEPTFQHPPSSGSLLHFQPFPAFSRGDCLIELPKQRPPPLLGTHRNAPPPQIPFFFGRKRVRSLASSFFFFSSPAFFLSQFFFLFKVGVLPVSLPYWKGCLSPPFFPPVFSRLLATPLPPPQ